MSFSIPSSNNVLVGTIPRSGTNLIFYFIIFYEIFLEDKQLNHKNIFKLIDLKKTINEFTNGLRKRKNLKIDKFFVGHAYCPGFVEYGKSTYKSEWNLLPYDEDWWNVLGNAIRDNKILFYPQLNKNAKIIFLYRNPFDVMASLYRHLENHRHKPQNISNFDGFFKYYINCYIKTYLSYIETFKSFPNNILMVRYENLMRNKTETLKSIFDFIGHPVRKYSIDSFHYAVKITSIENMKKLEHYLGKTLADDQKLPPGKESHLRGGEIGKWKKVIDKDQIKYATKLFNKFGISLKTILE